jgi:hypothetical protein
MNKFTFFLVVASFFGVSIQAQTRFVATTGNDTANDCSLPGSPCLTINHAISQALSNETI